MPKVIVVEGLIASGKTSLLNILKSKYPNSHSIFEPVDEWEKSGALNEFYDSLKLENPSPYIYTFQTYAFMSRIKRILNEIKKVPDAEVYFLERSIFSDRYLFVDMLMESGLLSKKDYQLYTDWWELWSLVMPVKIDGFIYLNPSPEECIRRLKNRNRSSEKEVTLEYQNALKEKHDNFLKRDIKIEEKIIPCLELNTDSDFRVDNKEILEKIKNFVDSI